MPAATAVAVAANVGLPFRPDQPRDPIESDIAGAQPDPNLDSQSDQLVDSDTEPDTDTNDDPTVDRFWTESVVHPHLSLGPHPQSGRGLSVVATHPIPVGTLLMREPPIMSLPSWALTVPDLRMRWKMLDEISKVKIWRLAAGGFHQAAVAEPTKQSTGSSFGPLTLSPAVARAIRAVPVEPPGNRRGRYSHAHAAPFLCSTDGEGHPWARMLQLAHQSTDPSVLRVFATNAIALPAGCDAGEFDGWGDGGAGVFEAISRVNHSCIPNSGLWFRHDDRDDCAAADCPTEGFQPDQDDVRGVMELRTTRPLAAGEEVTITYTDPYQSAERRQEMLGSYGFECACPACDADGTDPLPPAPESAYGTAADDRARLSPTAEMRRRFFAASASRRARIEQIDNTLPSSGRFLAGTGRNIHTSAAGGRLRLALEMTVLLRQESLLGARLARVYLDVACLAEFLGDHRHAYLAALAALPHYRTSVGPTHRYYIQSKRMVQRLRIQAEAVSG